MNTMKPMPSRPRCRRLLAVGSVLLAFGPLGPAFGEESHEHHDHAHPAKIAGPNGGRVITSVEPHLELLVTNQRKIELRAVNDEGEVLPLAEQQVRVIGGDRAQPTRLSFTREEGVLVSDGVLPAGEKLPLVVRIRPAEGAQEVIERFTLNLADCPGCDFLEYACVCDHASHEGHDH